MSLKDPALRRAYKHSHYLKNAQVVKARSAQRHLQGKAFLDELKSNPCMDCGESFPPECMDFDHVKGEKIRNLSKMVKVNRGKVLAEIEKCELVCANCHRTRTRSRTLRGKVRNG